ncbi:hypothetical protein MP228_012211 [Amoeboaphelidium protococcarum]|nr:hypothetical protein MP228_012211 [Amoeboaphelidium protococcarum]
MDSSETNIQFGDEFDAQYDPLFTSSLKRHRECQPPISSSFSFDDNSTDDGEYREVLVDTDILMTQSSIQEQLIFTSDVSEDVSLGIASDEFSDNLDLVSSDHLHALLSDEFEQFNEEDFRILQYVNSLQRQISSGTSVRLHNKKVDNRMLYKLLEVIVQQIKSNSKCTKRDVYYKYVDVFLQQRNVDTLVDLLSLHFQCPRSSLRVYGSLKGIIYGDLTLNLHDGTQISCNSTSLIPHVDSIQSIKSNNTIKNQKGAIDHILIVEKCATFTHLVNIGIQQLFEGHSIILVCGKGYPDLNTQLFLLYLMKEMPNAKVSILVDCDPHGIDIMRIYEFGSAKHTRELHHQDGKSNLLQPIIPSLKWIGLKPSHMLKYNLPQDQLIKLTEREVQIAQNYLTERHQHMDGQVRRELTRMLKLGYKAEIQALYSQSNAPLIDFIHNELILD